MSAKKGTKKRLTGSVVSDAMDKTVVVSITTLVKHPLYKKFVRRRVKYMAHDENNQYKVGDRVVISEVRPLSRRKRWRVAALVESAK
ncbi:MAG TPA: 30S ribosomal protein S17 [Deltaproteobacteria bacterium]|nr:30S ribosomal protein S17 [Deltaproteobacteria bacterium]